VSQTSRPMTRRDEPAEQGRPEPAGPRPSRRRPPEAAPWACLRNVDLLLPLMIVLLLGAAVAGAVGLTYAAL
jgi:hypothetical protein